MSTTLIPQRRHPDHPDRALRAEAVRAVRDRSEPLALALRSLYGTGNPEERAAVLRSLLSGLAEAETELDATAQAMLAMPGWRPAEQAAIEREIGHLHGMRTVLALWADIERAAQQRHARRTSTITLGRAS